MKLLMIFSLTIVVSFYAAKATSDDNVKYMLDNIPDGFEEAFSAKKSKVKVIVLGHTEVFNFIWSYAHVQLDKNDVESFSMFLSKNGIAQKISNELISSLAKGTLLTNDCVGVVSECVLHPERFGFVFDYDNEIFKIFVNPEYVNKKIVGNYYNSKTSGYSMVNNTSAYANYSDGYSYIDLSNKTHVSMPVGHFSADTLLSNGRSEVYEAKYNFYEDDIGFNLGFGNGLSIDNNSNSLVYNDVAKSYQVSVFNTRKLLKNQKEIYNSLKLYSPEAANVEVYRGERLIYRGDVMAGDNTIPYKTFPLGSYEVSVVIKKFGNEISRYSYFVANTRDYEGVNRELDWFAAAGIYDLRYYNYSHKPLDYNYNNSYLKLGSSTKIFKNLFIGLGLEYIDNDLIFVGRFETRFNEDLQMSILHSFANSSYYREIDFRSFGVAINYEHLESNNEFSILNSTMQQDDYKLFSISYPFRIYGDLATLNYSKISSQTLGFSDNNTYFLDSESFIASYSKEINKAYLGLSVGYNKSNNVDDYAVALSINIPFGGGYGNINSSHSRANNALQAHFSKKYNYSKNLDVDLQSGWNLSHSHDNYAQLGGRLNYNNGIVSGNSQGQYTTDGEFTGSTLFNSTQMFDSDGIEFTSNNRKAFLVVNNKVADNDSIRNSELVNISIANNRYETLSLHTVMANESNNNILGLEEFTKYDLQLDSVSDEFYYLGEEFKSSFVKPGGLIRINSNYELITKMLLKVNGSDGNVVTSLKCNGSACGQLDFITSGIYQLSLLKSQDLQLFTLNEICFLPIELGDISIAEVHCFDKNKVNELLLNNGDHLSFVGYVDEVSLLEKQMPGEFISLSNGIANAIFMIADPLTRSLIGRKVVMPSYEQAANIKGNGL